MKRFLCILAVSLCLASCEKYYFAGMVAPAGENVDERFRQSMAFNDLHGYQTIRTFSDLYAVHVFTDSHLAGETGNLDRFVNDYFGNNGAAPFAICLGDLVDGEKPFTEFITHTSPIEDAGRKLFITAGNHDLYWGRWKEFYNSFGSSTYWFEVVTPNAKDLYISVESGGGTLGVRQREWLEEILRTKSSGYRNVIVFTHTHFFMKDTSQGHTSNFALEETYDLSDLFSRYGVDLVLTGHDHYREQTVFKGVEYVIVDALEEKTDNAGYAVVNVGRDIEVGFVSIGGTHSCGGGSATI